MVKQVERTCLECWEFKLCHPTLGICDACFGKVWLPATVSFPALKRRIATSYDVELKVYTGIEEYPVTELGNITYNLAPMFCLALGGDGLNDLEGQTGAVAAPLVRRGLADMAERSGLYRAMNPKNGWGDMEGAMAFMRNLAEACERHPNAIVRIS